MKKHILLILSLIISIIPFAQNEQNMKTALILIDIQQFYFVDGPSQLSQPEAASEVAAQVLDKFRADGNLIVHIQHETQQHMDIHENVLPRNGEKVITKNYVNSYRDTDLLDHLRKNEIERVVICGMMTHVCVEGASRASADYGFDVIVIGDACATRDVAFNGKTVDANDVHNSTLATINTYYGKVLSSEEFLSN